MVSAPADWSVVWEDDLDDHAAVAELLARAFPRSFTPFGGQRSFSSARPERRLLARDGARVIAHAGILRRFVQVAGQPQLVGDVGLVAVDPDRQGTGLGGLLLTRTAAELHALGMPFGLLTCGAHVEGFYARGGWVAVPGPTRMVRADGRVQVYGGVTMVLPVREPLGRWLVGRVDRNGQEV